MTENDPLRHADVGETRTVTAEQKWSIWDSIPDDFIGIDRDLKDLDVDAKVVGTGDDMQIKVTYEGEVTKYLHPRWDREPRENARSQYVRPLWKRLLSQSIGAIIALLAVFVGFPLVQSAMNGITINGEAMNPSPYSIVPIVIVIGLVYVLVGLIEYRNYRKEQRQAQ